MRDDSVARARRRFERGMAWGARNKKIKLGFYELLGYFANDGMRFRDIGRLACEEGVSRQRIYQLYNEYFRPLSPGKRTGRERERVRILKRHEIAAEAIARDFSGEESLAKIAQLAREAGCRVERALQKSQQPIAFSGCF